jgi:transcriptional regulator with XRE-family HTH domain
MDVCLLIRQRLEELSLEQKDLAVAANVTESYISQLLTRKKMPPAPDHTDIYEKMATLLKLPSDQLSILADLQRKEELLKKLSDPPTPLFKEIREFVLHKCPPEEVEAIRAIFEKQPFGELERLVTHKLLDVVKQLVKEELDNENWLRLAARLSGHSYEEFRVISLEFQDTDIFNLSPKDCVSFLSPLIESWHIDLTTFGMDIVLNRRLASGYTKRLEFVARESDELSEQEPGLKEFLRDPSLSGDATDEEIQFLKKLQFRGKRPTALYYYRELQNLRDPVHFRKA